MTRSAIILWQSSLNPGKSHFTTPYDSTVGVGPGFYVFSMVVLVVIALGVGKVWLQDRTWKGRYVDFNSLRNRTIDEQRKERVARTRILTKEERESIIKELSKKIVARK